MQKVNKRNFIIAMTCIFLVIISAVMTLSVAIFGGTDKIDIMIISKSNDMKIDFWRSLKGGMQDACDEYGYEFNYKAPANEGDIKGQRLLIEEALISKPDIVLLAAVDYKAINDDVKKLLDAGIYVLTFDSGISLEHDNLIGFVGINNYQTANDLSKFASEKLHSKNAIIIGHEQGSKTARERVDGFNDGLKLSGVNVNSNNIKYSESGEGKTYIEDARAKTLAMLKADKDVDVIFATNEMVAIGSQMAVKDLMNEPSDRNVSVIGFDGSKRQVIDLESGVCDYLAVQRAFKIGYSAVSNAVDNYLKGKTVGNLYIDVAIIDKTNMYDRENQEILFPI